MPATRKDTQRFDTAPALFLDQFEELRMELSNEQLIAEAMGIVMTGPDGGYQFAIGSGPSRELAVVHRPDQRELTTRATLRTKVRPTFRLVRKVVKNKGFAIFKGAVGPHSEKVVVVLQVKSGKGWRVFRRYRTREGGRFLMRYRFTQTYTPTTYIMRAQSGYPYEEGNSLAIPVSVEP